MAETIASAHGLKGIVSYTKCIFELVFIQFECSFGTGLYCKIGSCGMRHTLIMAYFSRAYHTVQLLLSSAISVNMSHVSNTFMCCFFFFFISYQKPNLSFDIPATECFLRSLVAVGDLQLPLLP